MRTLIASLVLAGVTLSLTPVATGETVHLVRIVEMDRTKSFSLMSADEFREAQALINAERRLFPKALQMTLASWTEDGIYPPFPRNSITLRSIAKIATYNSMDVAQIKLAYCQAQEEKRRKAFEKRRNDRQKGDNGKQEEAWAKEKAELVKKAHSILHGNLASLVAQDEAEHAALLASNEEP